jgi:hypothetical protein
VNDKLEGIRKRGKEGTFNVTLQRVRVTIFDFGKQNVLHILTVCL